MLQEPGLYILSFYTNSVLEKISMKLIWYPMAIINSRSALEFHERFFDWTNQKAKKQGLIKGVD